jgi:uncharacterized membrane protein
MSTSGPHATSSRTADAASNGHSDSNGHAGPEQKLVPLLGWASLALGVPQTTRPGDFDRFIGVKPERDTRAVTVFLCGVRELAAAAGILALERRRPVHFLWARVAGDALDLGLLGKALKDKPEKPQRILAALGAVVGITAADVYAALRLSRTEEPTATEVEAMDVRAAITVRRSREDVYGFWRDFHNLPRFMAHLEAVEPAPNGRSHWKASGPAGRSVEWDAEILRDEPGEEIAWHSLPGSDVDNSGSVRFTQAPGDQGTEIHLHLQYDPPGGKLGEVVAKLFGEEPSQQVKDDLRRLKQVLETGEVVRSEGTPEGTHARRFVKQRPAQPLEDSEILERSQR